jgi:hypothetical protein
MILPLGKIVVPTPGTPVSLGSAILATLGVSPSTIRRLNLVCLGANAGKIYVGTIALNKTTLAGCFVGDGLAAGQSLNLYDETRQASAHNSPGYVGLHGSIMDLYRIFIDADNANDGIGGYAIY